MEFRQQDDAAQREPNSGRVDTSQEFHDRRQNTRIRMEVPARIEVFDSINSAIAAMEATVTGISRAGISATVKSVDPLPGHVYLEMSLPGFDGNIKTQADVRWMKTLKGGRGFEYGLELSQTAPPYRELLHRFLSRVVADRTAVRDRRIRTTIRTEPFQFINSRGRRVVGFLDMPIEKNAAAEGSVVIVPPAYGETKTGGLSIAYFVASNGIPAVRYDASDHVGESDGDLLDCTLKKMHDDLIEIINHFQSFYGYRRFAVIAASLAARVAIKAAANEKRIEFLGGLVPVVNLRRTLKSVYNEDLVGENLKGQRWGEIDMLGFQIKADQFLSDAARWDFHFLSSTIKDLSQIKSSFYFVLGENDPWVDRGDVEEALRAAGHGESSLAVVPGMIHQFQENPQAVKECLRDFVWRVHRAMGDTATPRENIKDPNFREVALQARVEKEKLRYGVRKAHDLGSQEFWSRYLEQFHFISRIPQYKEFYERISTLLGQPESGDVIFDAGCGNGTFGVWLLSHNLAGMNEMPGCQTDLTYIGADFIAQALEAARAGHMELLADLRKTKPSIRLNTVYNVVDLNQAVPYMDNYFDQICSNLVLSYLSAPKNTLTELFRVLKPGGRMVITSLKPNPDLSLIYRAFMLEAKTAEEAQEARRLLNNAASILEKEREGRFKFFSDSELFAMAHDLGATKFSIERAFGNQANILFIQK